MRNWLIHTLGALLLAGLAGAQDGKALYGQYCSACHGFEGEGVGDGQFPPLADSLWVKGDAGRVLQIVIHGLQGPIEVNGKDYNLVMPPQGEALTNEQIASIVTYVRSSWGHEESAVTPADVQAQRDALESPSGMWLSQRILMRHPLPKEPVSKGPVKNLIATIHHGKFNTVEELWKSEGAAVEEEHDGVLRIDNVGRQDAFGIVWTGDLEIAQDGEFTFILASDDGSMVEIDRKPVVALNRIGPMGKPTEGKVKLERGSHKLRVSYFENSGQEGFSLGMTGPGIEGMAWLSPAPSEKPQRKVPPSIPITAPEGEAVIYRNFIEGSTPRAIGVGYHGGVNLAFSADTMGLELIWTGKFMNGGRHWTDRGQGFQKPAGEKVLKISEGPAFALLEDPASAWPAEYPESLAPAFRGYQFNEQQEPTFFYTLGGLEVTDRPDPQPERPALTRTITIESGKGAPPQVAFRAAMGWPLQVLGDGRFDLGGQAVITISGGGTPYLRGGKELIVPVDLSSGKATLTLTYTWN